MPAAVQISVVWFFLLITIVRREKSHGTVGNDGFHHNDIFSRYPRKGRPPVSYDC